jgi:hypothetical protein
MQEKMYLINKGGLHDKYLNTFRGHKVRKTNNHLSIVIYSVDKDIERLG